MAISSKKRIWGWMAFDWASQPFYTLGLTFIFGPYFAAVAADYYLTVGSDAATAKAQAQGLWSGGQTVAGLLIAFSAPFLGAFADNSGRKMPWIAFFSIIFVVATTMLWGLTPDGSSLVWMLIIFYVGFFAAESALNFVNAILPSLGNKDEVGRISGSGAAFGYWGGVVSLFIMLRDDPTLGGKPTNLKSVAGELWETLKSVKERKSLLNFLIGSMFYRDALNALYAFGGVYAALVLDWQTIQIGVFGIVAAIAAAITTWLAGLADQKYGPKPVIRIAVWSLIVVSVLPCPAKRRRFSRRFSLRCLPTGPTITSLAFYL